MEYQSFGRAQKPKGANIKQAMKVMIVLAVCAWLLYQINHSGNNNTENYSGQTKLGGGYEAISLGRKGTPPRLDAVVLPDSGNVDSGREAKESSSDKDDGSHGAKEDKAEDEFEGIDEKFRTGEGKEVKLEQESQPKVTSKNKYKDLSKTKSGKVGLESSGSESGHRDFGNEEYPKRSIINDSESNDKEKEVQLREQVNDGDEEPKIREKETRMQKNEVENATSAADLTDEIEEVQSFHDENGVPPDVNETEIVFDQAHIQYEDNISNLSKGSWLKKYNIYEVTSGEDNSVEVNVEGSKNEETADEEINTLTITRVNTLGIKRNSELIREGDS